MSTHVCPVGRCTRRVADHHLMCREHWRMVPNGMQYRVYRTWANGKGALTPEHQAAMKEAIAAVEAELPRTLL